MRCLAAAVGDDPADGGGAGEEDVVPPLGEQRGGLVDAALDDDDGVGVDVARDEPGQRGRAGRRQLGRLGHHAVAGGERRGHRLEEELDRVVPRGDHQRHAERLGLHPALGRRHGDRQAHLRRAHPPLDVLGEVAQLALRVADVGGERLHGAGGPGPGGAPRPARPRPPPSSGAGPPAAPGATPAVGCARSRTWHAASC